MKTRMVSIIVFLFCNSSSYCQDVGIGVTGNNINARLHVSKRDSGLAIFENQFPFTDSSKTRLFFKAENFFTGAIGTMVENAAAYKARLGLFTYSATVPGLLKERLTINDDGNVGVNIVNPSATLDINGSMRLRGNGAAAGKVLTSDANGNASWQNAGSSSAVGFNAYLSTGKAVSNQGITVPGAYTEDYDDGNGFDPAAGTFIAPSAGLYHFTIVNYWMSAPTAVNVHFTSQLRIMRGTLMLRTINAERTEPYKQFNGCSQELNYSFKLNAGDRVSCVVWHDYNGNITLVGGDPYSLTSSFSGFKVY